MEYYGLGTCLSFNTLTLDPEMGLFLIKKIVTTTTIENCKDIPYSKSKWIAQNNQVK